VATAIALLIGTLAVLAFIGFVAPSSAARGGLHCGSVVTRSVTLHRDIVGCGHAGLIVGRSGITVDLAGHTIGGVGKGWSRRAPLTADNQPRQRRQQVTHRKDSSR
jgi:hypothetical protein